MIAGPDRADARAAGLHHSPERVLRQGEVPLYGRGRQVRDRQDGGGGPGCIWKMPIAGGRQCAANEGQTGAEE